MTKLKCQLFSGDAQHLTVENSLRPKTSSSSSSSMKQKEKKQVLNPRDKNYSPFFFKKTENISVRIARFNYYISTPLTFDTTIIHSEHIPRPFLYRCTVSFVASPPAPTFTCK